LGVNPDYIGPYEEEVKRAIPNIDEEYKKMKRYTLMEPTSNGLIFLVHPGVTIVTPYIRNLLKESI
jgi:hypothetical protein